MDGAGVTAAREADVLTLAGFIAARLGQMDTLDLARAVLEHGWISPRSAQAESVDADQTVTRLGDLLTGVAEALKGKPEPLTAWSYHDLPALARDVARVANQRATLEKTHVWWQDGYVAGLRYAAQLPSPAVLEQAIRAGQVRLEALEKEGTRR